jgi:transcriptional regulator with XRE-family HTH domain/Zn-dependent peptidase ImmA (M78 family)
MDPALKELGRRLAARRSEAHLSIRELSASAQVPETQLDAFEAGNGTLGVAALTRVARALGVPENSFFHTAVKESPALRAPSFMLSETGRGSSLSTDDTRILGAYLRQAREFAGLGDLLGMPGLAEQFKPSPARSAKPFLQGYDLARRVRTILGADRAPLRRVRQMFEDQLNILVVDHAFTDRRIQAASCRSGNARLVAISPTLKHETSRRAILAHELCHQLADLSQEGVVTDEAIDDADGGFSMDRSPEEKRARAFAIMLLAPSDAFRESLGQPSNQLSVHSAADAVSFWRRHFGIGFQAMTWHLFHLGYFNFHEDEVAKLASYGDGLEVSGFEDAGSKDGLQARVEEALRRDAISGERARLILGQYLPAAA